MDFSYTEEQGDVQKLALEILSEQATPERQKEVELGGERYDSQLWATVAEAGLLGVAFNEAYGGMNFDFTELCLVAEEVGRSVAPIPYVQVIVSGGLPVQRFGNSEQKARLLPGLVSGESTLVAGFMEAGNEDPAAPVRTSAIADGDGFILNGEKHCVPYADRAERVLVSAKTDTGVVALLLDPKAEGVTLTALVNTAYEPQFKISLNNVKVAAADVLSAQDGAEVMRWAAERTTVAYCAQMTGITDKMMRMTATYTTERKQFDVPVATFQAVGHRMADCYIDVDALRLVTQQAVSLLESEEDATTEVQIAKIWAGDTGHRVSYAAQHCHGGIGIDRDYPLWRYCLQARNIEMTLGSSASNLALLGERMAQGLAFAD
jgi:alkylation response protein AidB-like acyl-CoA dehydrogenase